MTIAVLFNSDDIKYGGWYGGPIRNEIFQTKVLQDAKREMEISVGDILVFSHSETGEQYIENCEKIYFVNSWNFLQKDKLIYSYRYGTIYAWVIKDIVKEIATELNNSLLDNSAYLGMHDIDFDYPYHLTFYKKLLIPEYRIKGNTITMFYSFDNEEEIDDTLSVELKKLGFEEIKWEHYIKIDDIFNN